LVEVIAALLAVDRSVTQDVKRDDEQLMRGGDDSFLLALASGTPWPTMSSMLRAFMRPVAGRAVLFGLWLWLGWHLFIRGWSFFLRR